jgi:hypothetical protein
MDTEATEATDVGPRVPSSTPMPAPAGSPWVDVKDFGAVGDGVTDDRVAIQNALNAVALGGEVLFPAGTYLLGKKGPHDPPYSLTLPGSNVTLRGVKGASWLKHAAGQPGQSVVILYVQDVSHVTIRDLGFDGNWGNSVGGTDSQAGINQGTQADPQSHGLMIRAATDVLVENCLLRQIYGDAAWIGHDATAVATVARAITFRGCTVDMCARSGIALGGNADGVHVSDCRFTNIFATAFDTEPGGGGVSGFARDVLIERTLLGGWWNPANPARNVNSPLSISGGGGIVPPSQAIFARLYRVRDCTIEGGIQITTAYDVKIESCRILADHEGHSFCPIVVQGFADDVWISDNEIYCRTTSSSGGQQAAVAIAAYASGPLRYQPAGVRVHGNRIHARRGAYGIAVVGSGGVSSADTGTSSGSGATTLTDDTKAWTPNQWFGHAVVTGGVCGVVTSNTKTQLTIHNRFTDGVGWRTPLGDAAATPAAGLGYTILSAQGVVDVRENAIDLTDDGHGQGRHGIYVQALAPGMRVKIAGNEVLNANGAGVRIDCTDSARPFLLLELVDNVARDNQVTPTCVSTLQFNVPSPSTVAQCISKLIMRGNQADGAAAVVAGLHDGRWLVSDGAVAQWAGYGSPEGSVKASPGALYVRLDGGAGRTLYVKESGDATTTGWIAYGAGGPPGTDA